MRIVVAEAFTRGTIASAEFFILAAQANFASVAQRPCIEFAKKKKFEVGNNSARFRESVYIRKTKLIYELIQVASHTRSIQPCHKGKRTSVLLPLLFKDNDSHLNTKHTHTRTNLLVSEAYYYWPTSMYVLPVSVSLRLKSIESVLVWTTIKYVWKEVAWKLMRLPLQVEDAVLCSHAIKVNDLSRHRPINQSPQYV